MSEQPPKYGRPAGRRGRKHTRRAWRRISLALFLDILAKCPPTEITCWPDSFATRRHGMPSMAIVKFPRAPSIDALLTKSGISGTETTNPAASRPLCQPAWGISSLSAQNESSSVTSARHALEKYIAALTPEHQENLCRWVLTLTDQ